MSQEIREVVTVIVIGGFVGLYAGCFAWVMMTLAAIRDELKRQGKEPK